MTPYAWSCLACSQTNPGTASTCGRCGCPAETNNTQVVLARDAWRRRSGLPPLAPPDPIGLLTALPLLPIAAVVFLVLGAVMLIVNLGASPSAFGGLMLALAALCASSYRPPESPRSLAP